MRFIAVILLFLLSTIPALAQDLSESEQSVPTEAEVEHTRILMLQAELQYFYGRIRRGDANAKILAAWWASYVSGLGQTK